MAILKLGNSNSEFSGSFSGSFQGDGSQLTGISGGSAFPFTGDASITGSLTISGSFIPRGAGVSHISNVSIGQDAGPGLTSGGQYNVIVGSNAGENLDDEDYGVFIGGQAARYLQYGSSTPNVIIGGLAGASLKGQLGVGANDIKGNVFLGYGAGQGGVTNNTMAVQNNVGIGYQTLSVVSGGQNNIALGFKAGASISDGDSNIIIGSGSLGEASISNQLRIGNGNSLVTISGSLTTGDVIFYNTASAPNFSGSFQGDGSQLTGVGGSSGKFGIANSSGEYTYYSDLSSSLQAATSGDTIQLFTTVTESADHSYHLKNGVDFNFNGNELFYETTTTSGLEIFTDNGAQVSCSFYNGRVRFNQPNTGTNKLIYLTGTGTEINNLGFEWEVIDGTSNPIHLQATSGVVNGGKFIAGPSVTGYFIRHYFTLLKNVEIITYNASALFSYFAPIKNSQIYGYLLNTTNISLIYQNVNGLDMDNCYVYLEGPTTGTRNKITSGGRTFTHNSFTAKEATGIICASSIGNDIFVDDGDYALTVGAEVVGGNIDITGGQGLITGNEATSGVRVTGLNIRVKDYLGPAAQVGTNTSLMGCNFFEDYGQQDTDMIQVKTGCTGVEVANCTFDFFNVAGRIGNYGITAVDDGTVVKFANNTIMGGTLFEASKVTQGILNTPDAQGNMSMTF
jgi:hypothetical protein